MAIAKYPASLPCLRPDNYSIQSDNPLQTAQMQTGRVRTRERWRAVPSRISVQVRMTQEQLFEWEGFFKHSLRNGADAFELPLLMSRSKSLQSYTVYFTDIYSGPDRVMGSSGSNPLFDISFSVLTIGDPRTTEQEYADILLGIPIDDAEEQLEEGINTHWIPLWTP